MTRWTNNATKLFSKHSKKEEDLVAQQRKPVGKTETSVMTRMFGNINYSYFDDQNVT